MEIGWELQSLGREGRKGRRGEGRRARYMVHEMLEVESVRGGAVFCSMAKSYQTRQHRWVILRKLLNQIELDGFVRNNEGACTLFQTGKLDLTSWSVKSFPPTILNTIPFACIIKYGAEGKWSEKKWQKKERKLSLKGFILKFRKWSRTVSLKIGRINFTQ